MIDKIKEFRLEIDSLYQAVNQLDQSSETFAACKALQMSKGWLGKCLGALPNPDDYKVVTEEFQIPPTREVSNRVIEFSDGSTRLYKVNFFRKELVDLQKEFKQWMANVEFQSGWDYNDFVTFGIQAYLLLHEASMHLGFELGQMRGDA